MCKICEKYPYSAGPSKGAFSTRSCENTTHPSHSFRQHENSERHKRLEAKLYDSSYIEEAFINSETKMKVVNIT